MGQVSRADQVLYPGPGLAAPPLDPRHFLERLLAGSPNLVYIYDLVAKSNVYANRHLLEFLGHGAGQVRDLGAELMANILHPEDVEAVARHHAGFADATDDDIRVLAYRVRHADGDWRWLQSRDVVYSRGEDGAPRQILGSAEEITVERRSLEALEESEFFFKESQRAASVGSYKCDFRAGTWQSSEVLDVIFGIDGHYVRSIPGWLNLIHPEDLGMMSRYLAEEVIGRRQAFSKEYRIVRKSDGVIRWVQGLGNVGCDPQGTVISLIGTIQDITGRRQAEEALRQSEKDYRALVNNLTSGVVVHGADTAVLYANPMASYLLGLTEDQMRGKAAIDPEWRFLAEDGSPLPLEIYPVNRVLATTDGFQGQVIGICRPDRAETTWVLCGGYPMKDAEGGLIQAVITFSDITELKQSRAELIASEESLAITLHSIGDAVVATDVAGIITRMNATAERMTGWTLAEALGRPLPEVFRIIDARTRSASIDPVQAVLAQGEVVGLANGTVLLARDGQEYQIADSAAPIRDVAGKIVGVVLVFSDITEKYRIEAALRETNELLALFIRHSPIYTYIKEVTPTEGRILQASENFEQMIGIRGSDMVGKTMTDVFPAALAAKTLIDDLAVVSGGKVLEVEEAFDGRSYTTLKFPIVQGGKTLLAGFTIDITERKRAVEALQESGRRMQLATYSARLAIWDWDLLDGTMLWDDRMFEIYGTTREEVLGTVQDWKDGLHPEDLDRAIADCEAAIKGERPFDTEFRLRHKDGTVVWVKANATVLRDPEGNPVRMVGINRDVTDIHRIEQEKARLQAQLMQSQKMDSLGTLAGGVAHDMNNVLGAILALASTHLASLPGDTPLYTSMETIRAAAARGGDMVKRLLTFSRQAPSEQQELNLNALLLEEARLLERTTLAKVHLEMDLAPDLHPVLGDGSALTHAVMNLCVNAVDAMGDGGTLAFRTRNLGQDQVAITVEDNGCGMPPEVLARAMEPFYTTKAVGKGTGLGLSMVFATVKAHGGRLAIKSEPGRGTQVTVTLSAAVARGHRPEPAAAVSREVAGNAMQVLLVDDDELIQKSTRMLVEAMGHAVTLAASGEQALRLLEQGLQPDVVILDMNMPGLGGKGTLPRLRGLCPAVPVFLATGRADQEALDLVASQPFVTLLSKPFSFEELRSHLKQPCHQV